MFAGRMTSRIALCLAAVACGAAPAARAGSYECTLKAALPGEKDLLLLVDVRGPRVARHGLMAAGLPATAQRVKDCRLKVAGNRLTGPVEVQIGPARHRFDIDVRLDAGGTYQAHFGCPEPTRKVTGSVAVEAPAARGRCVLTLRDAFGHDTPLELLLELDRQAKSVQAVHGQARTYNTARYPLDVSGLKCDGASLAGQVGVTVVPDAWVPAHRQAVAGAVALNVRLDGKGEAGTYSATFGIDRMRPGQVAVRPIAEAQMEQFLALDSIADQLRSDQVQVVNELTPWRVRLVRGPAVFRDGGELKWNPPTRRPERYDPAAAWAKYVEAGLADPLPPEGWAGGDFDDRTWPRWSNDLFEHFGGYGFGMDASGRWPVPALLCLRTWFGVDEPARAADLKVTVRCVGGAAVYVNGKEVGRAFLPRGPLAPTTPAEEYPIAAYTADDDKTPLPGLFNPQQPEAKLAGRYRARVRDFTVAVPSSVLVKGRNVLAVELHRAAAAGPFSRGAWSHVGIWRIWAASRSGAGLVGYDRASAGTRVWSAAATEQVAAELPRHTVLPANRFWYIYNDDGIPVKGIHAANPYDPLEPLRMVAPRNGACSGQAIISDPNGVRDVTASVADFRGGGGAVIPAAAAEIRFAATGLDVHYCDRLEARPPKGARTVPVWVILKVPADQKPGWYVSTLRIGGDGRSFDVPVGVLVSACRVPDPRNNHSNVAMMQSPDSVAIQYKVRPWSPEHFRLLDKSFKLLGELGNDVLYVPVIVSADKGEKAGAIRWVKDGAGWRGEFGAFEKLLDVYVRHCGEPKAVALCVWSAATATSVARAYEGSQTPSAPGKASRPLLVTLLEESTGRMSDMPAPRFGENGDEAFWRPMLEGVRQVVRKRGWSDRVIVLGEGGDVRPSRQTGELLRRWAPYARWDILSHFSGDPGSGFYKGPHKDDFQAGRMIATGDLEVALKEYPGGGICRADQLAARLRQRLDYLDLPNHRWQVVRDSPPVHFRTLLQGFEGLSRFGLDFWPVGARGRSLLSGWTGGSRVRAPVDCVTAPGPDGAEPTVRFEMMREAIQDLDVRIAILRAVEGADQQRRKECLELLDGLRAHVGPQYAAYAARVYEMAARLAGASTGATWDNPPRP